nr:hypothetical protein [Angustibacter aerolatus]
MWFGQVAMQPGKPQGFGTVGPDETPIFTLPGNPVRLVRVVRGVRAARDPQGGRAHRAVPPLREGPRARRLRLPGRQAAGGPR